MPLNSLTARHQTLAPFEHFEAAIVRHSLARPGSIHPRHEAAIRYALSLARLAEIDTSTGPVITLPLLAEFRERLQRQLADCVRTQPGKVSVDTHALNRLVPEIVRSTRSARARLVVQLGNRLPAEMLERELTERALVLACGGGGGSAFVHVGAFALLESAGLRPSLIAGASMGAILGLFRARAHRFDVSQVPKIMGELETRRVFRPFSAENRYTLPAAIRLELREGIGPYFQFDGVPLRLKDLPIPLLATVAGIRRGALPIPSISELGQGHELPLPPQSDQRSVARRLIRTLGRLVVMPEMLKNVVLGGDDDTREFDAVDAVGFSSAVPGALSYDLVRSAPVEENLLESIFREHSLLRVTDGGVADNVPARTAWRAVQQGTISTRNAFILALDGFSPRLSTPLWLPIQQVAYQNVKRSIAYSNLYFAFRRTLSPVELLPRSATVMRNVETAKQELLVELPFIQRMLETLPGVVALAAA